MDAAPVLRLLLSGACFVAATATAQAAVYRCPGGVIQDRPCQVVAPPPPEPPRPPCVLPPEALKRAAREEDQFLNRYRDEDAHRRAQFDDLALVARSVRATRSRLTEVEADYRKIAIQLEFFRNKPLPPSLLNDVNSVSGRFAALTSIFDNLRQDIGVIDARYQCQRATFARMWSGAARGSSACDRPACSPG